ncbi:MAG: hypothetical protein KF705_12845 [Phycisphaeraceae bacterium]|nr:hypothetical protein [Phycisphaeraceae bacterium]
MGSVSWSQRDGSHGVDPASASGIPNQAMDQRWSLPDVLAEAEPGSVIFSRFEKVPARLRSSSIRVRDA